MDETDVGDGTLARVVDLEDREVVAVHRHLERVLVARAAFGIHVQHVAEQEGRAFLLHRIGEEAQGPGDVGAVGRRFQAYDLADDVQEVAAALLRRDELLDAVAEEESSDLVVVEYGGEGQHRRYFGDKFALRHRVRTEKAGTADVDEQHDGKLALLLEDLDIGRAQARGDVPVHVADIVAVLVLAHLAESHAPALVGGMVFARKDLMAQRPGPDLDLPDLLEKVCRLGVLHYGTITALMTWEMISSVVTFSASASYVRPMR